MVWYRVIIVSALSQRKRVERERESLTIDGFCSTFLYQNIPKKKTRTLCTSLQWRPITFLFSIAPNPIKDDVLKSVTCLILYCNDIQCYDEFGSKKIRHRLDGLQKGGMRSSQR